MAANLNVDLTLLKRQKQTLVAMTFGDGLTERQKDHLDGIINLLDVVQDDLESHGSCLLERETTDGR